MLSPQCQSQWLAYQATRSAPPLCSCPGRTPSTRSTRVLSSTWAPPAVFRWPTAWLPETPLSPWAAWTRGSSTLLSLSSSPRCRRTVQPLTLLYARVSQSFYFNFLPRTSEWWLFRVRMLDEGWAECSDHRLSGPETERGHERLCTISKGGKGD